MEFHTADIAVVIAFFLLVVTVGTWTARHARHDVEGYFLGGRAIPWYLLGISNASGMFDVAGTMWLTTTLFVYGLKSLWLPWLWPSFNQIFLMVFLSSWLRRSQAVTGAAWLETRFTRGRGLELSHLSVVFFALVSVLGYLAYAFEATTILAAQFFPWEATRHWKSPIPLTPTSIAILITVVTSFYVIMGGMVSVVWMDVLQYLLLVLVSVAVGLTAMQVSTAESLVSLVPTGWFDPRFGWQLDLDWSELHPEVSQKIAADGYEMFGLFFGLMLTKGILASLAGPAPNYDMQRILATRSDRDAAFMSALVSPVLMLPRYFFVAGIVALALHHLAREFPPNLNLEHLLPYVIRHDIPPGIRGLTLCGIVAAYMSTYDATVNAGAAYLVNDVFKRYLSRFSTATNLTFGGYVGSLLIVFAGIALGCQAESIEEILQWLTAGLFGGYIAPNLLKWYWWRLNGYGYFGGMMVGTGLALAGLVVWPGASQLTLFPVSLLASGLTCVMVSLLTPSESWDVLTNFYVTVRPWGLWQPVRVACVQRGMVLAPLNRDWRRDGVNCAVGIAWQWSLSALPVFFVFRSLQGTVVSFSLVLLTTFWLKHAWFDRLRYPQHFS